MDASIKGTPDLVILGESPTVVDYKTVLVVDEDSVRPGYERQLRIYAWLASQNYDCEIREAALFSLREGMVPVDVSVELIEQTIAEAHRAREAFDERTPGPQPAQPEATVCGWCDHACVCDESWDALDAGRIEAIGWGEAIRSTVSGDLVQAASGVAAVPVSIDQGTVTGGALVVDVPQSRTSSLSIGTRTAFVGLALRSEDPLSLAWREGISRMAVLQSDD